MMEINYCLSNIEAESRPFLQQLAVCVIEDFCLGRCGHCEAGPFVVVDGEVVTGQSHEEIWRQLTQEQEIL